METTYSNDHVIFASRWTVKDLKDAVNYQNDHSEETLNTMVSSDKVDELAEMVNDAVQNAIQDFMNAHF